MSNDSQEYKGYRIRIEQDTDAESPRTSYDNAGTLIVFHSRYELGDPAHGYRSIEELLEHVLTTGAVWLPVTHHEGHISSLSVDVVGMVNTRMEYGSGQFESTDDYNTLILDRQHGVIFMDTETVIKEFGNDSQESRMQALECLKGEIETYNQYLAGDIYGFVITKDCDLDDCDGSKQVDSCWGYYGEEDCKAEAKSVVDYLAKEELKKKRTTRRRTTKQTTKQGASAHA